MEAIASVLRPKFRPYTIVDAVNDACDSLISIINVRRQQLIDLIKIREQELVNIKTCKDRAHLEFIEADNLYETYRCRYPWYAKILPASFEEILHKSVFIKERRAYGEFKLSVKCDKEPFRAILTQITEVYLEVLNPEIMKYQHDTPHQHGIIGKGASGSRIGEYDHPKDIAYDDTTEELFITDEWNNRVVICNGAGGYIRHIGGRDVMIYPLSLAITPQYIYIGTVAFIFEYGNTSKYGNNELFMYSRTNYQMLTKVKLNPEPGCKVIIPSCLAIHSNTNMYMNDSTNSRISIYSEKLIFIQHFSHSLLDSVKGLILAGDKMYVLAGKGSSHCVLIFSSAYPHEDIKSIILHSEVRCGRNFCMDRRNNIIISDYESGNVKIFSPHGRLLNAIGKRGKQHKGELYYPTGICVTNTDSIICVNEHDNYCIQIFY